VHQITLTLRRAAPTAVALAIAAFILSNAPPHTIGPVWLLAALAVLALAWTAWQPFDTRRDDILPAIAIVLSSLGLLLVARISPENAQKQQYWLFVSLALAIAAGPVFTRFRRLASFKY